MQRAAGRPAVFVDRDGTINEERGHVHRVADFRLLPGAVDGLRRLRDAGFALVVVTNQAGIARGLYDEAAYATLTAHLRALLARDGVELDGVYHCPHHPTHGRGALRVACGCRKPAPGMLLRAAAELGLDLARSAIVGDSLGDLEAGRAAGVGRRVLVASGHPGDAHTRAAADAFCADLREAAGLIVRRIAPGARQAVGRFATSVRMS